LQHRTRQEGVKSSGLCIKIASRCGGPGAPDGRDGSRSLIQISCARAAKTLVDDAQEVVSAEGGRWL